MSRSTILGNTSSMAKMSVTTKGPFHSSRDVLLTDHTRQLLFIYKTMYTRYPLVRCNRLETLYGLIIFVRHDNGWLFLFHSDFLVPEFLDGVDNQVRDDCIDNVDQIYLIWKLVTREIGEISLYLGPFLSCLCTLPDSLRRKLFPIRKVFHPPHLRLLKQLLPSAEDVLAKSRRHVPEGWCVLLAVVVE